MSKFTQDGTGVVVSVSDEKDSRFGTGWAPFEAPTKRSSGRPKKSEEVVVSDDES